LNKYLYNDKSDIKVNISNNSERISNFLTPDGLIYAKKLTEKPITTSVVGQCVFQL